MTANVTATRASKAPRAAWPAPTGLILLGLIPVLAGAARLGELTGGAVPTIHNARFHDSPLPVVIHIVSATVFSLLGAFQFVPALRGRRNRWHRVTGRVLVPAGLLTALSGMWMAAFYSHPLGDGVALEALRLIFGSAMVASILLGIRAIKGRKYVAHSAWMTRGYAIGVGAGTQAIVLIPGSIVFGSTHEISRTILMGSAWVINLAVAEMVIRRRARKLPPLRIRACALEPPTWKDSLTMALAGDEILKGTIELVDPTITSTEEGRVALVLRPPRWRPEQCFEARELT